jgi:hypothetical protein
MDRQLSARWSDRHNEDNSRFSQFCECTKKSPKLLKRNYQLMDTEKEGLTA